MDQSEYPRELSEARDANVIKVGERRSEPRIEAHAPVFITPLAVVAVRLEGSVVDVSIRGVRVYFHKQLTELPKLGEIYRVQSRDDTMLCEVRNAEVSGGGAILGLQIIHWSDAGELRRLIQDRQ